MEKLKIVRVIARLNIGGPAVHVWTLSSEMGLYNFETILVAGACSNDEVSYNEENHLVAKDFKLIQMVSLGRVARGLNDLRALWQLIQIMRRERPQIVHTHTAKAGVLGRIAAWVTGVQIVAHTFHGHVFHGYFGLAMS